MKYVILVTGSNSGFGRLTVETLAKAGYTVFASMRNVDGNNAEAAQALQTWAQREQLTLHIVELDVTDDDSVTLALKQVIETTGQIDVIVNNAGVACAGVIEGFTIEQAKTLFEVNVLGPLRVNKVALPYMRKQGSGLLIHISSTFGRLAMPFSGLYSASKFALEGFAEAYHYELKPLGIDAVIIEPGPFPTDLGAKIVLPEDEQTVQEYGEIANELQKLGATLTQLFSSAHPPNPRDVADAVQKLIETPQGKRPLRTLVDPLTGELINAVNRASAQNQRSFLQKFGVLE
jgi:NAD(P)-dependent dehydrogenase (short-subunit alcohol dehydrogenase family)